MSNWFSKQMGNPSPPPAPPQPAPAWPPHPQAPQAPQQAGDVKGDGSFAGLNNPAGYEKVKAKQAERNTFCPHCGGQNFVASGSEAPRCFDCGHRSTSSGGSFSPGDAVPDN